jgi:hypothetical protein
VPARGAGARANSVSAASSTAVDSCGSVRGYFASFPDAHAASADMRSRFKFLGETGLWRLLTSASHDIGG